MALASHYWWDSGVSSESHTKLGVLLAMKLTGPTQLCIGLHGMAEPVMKGDKATHCGDVGTPPNVV